MQSSCFLQSRNVYSKPNASSLVNNYLSISHSTRVSRAASDSLYKKAGKDEGAKRSVYVCLGILLQTQGHPRTGLAAGGLRNENVSILPEVGGG